jgi:hypothetical protein
VECNGHCLQSIKGKSSARADDSCNNAKMLFASAAGGFR